MEINQKIKVIKEDISKVSSELITMVKNFLNMMPLSILIDRENYIVFEHLISGNNCVAKQFLDSNSEHREFVINKLRNNEDSYNNINHFLNEHYRKLVKVAGKHINVSDEYHSFIVWKLIRELAVQFISEYWNREYGVYLKEDNQITDLDEYVDLYCRCLDIPTRNITAVGSFTYYLLGKNIFPADINGNFVECNIYLIDKVFQKIEELELEAFENSLKKTQAQKSMTYSINDVDLMDGHEFERFIGLLFTKMGYMTEVTKSSGDQGLDVVAEKYGIKIGIQAKCYSNKVTNTAVQEITAALKHYNCNKGMVITNNYFTDSALKLAESNNIVIWDRDILKRKIEEIFVERNESRV